MSPPLALFYPQTGFTFLLGSELAHGYGLQRGRPPFSLTTAMLAYNGPTSNAHSLCRPTGRTQPHNFDASAYTLIRP
jgi:hypothetical protein